MGQKYRVIKRKCSEFGSKCLVFVIEKKTWIGFYWDTDEYYLSEPTAQQRCDELNREYYYKKTLTKY